MSVVRLERSPAATGLDDIKRGRRESTRTRSEELAVESAIPEVRVPDGLGARRGALGDHERARGGSGVFDDDGNSVGTGAHGAAG